MTGPAELSLASSPPALAPASVAEPSRARLVAAALACLAGAVGFACFHHAPSALLLPGALLCVSAGLIFRSELASHVFARAVLWSNLLLGFLIAVSGSGEEQLVGGFIALTTGAALHLVGTAGLRRSSEVFAPVAFRASLVLAVVMALADTQSLTLFGILQLDRGDGSTAYPLLACAGLMIVALYGLYRLRLWGLVLNIVANVVIAGLALTGSLDLPNPLIYALCTTATVQLLLPAPLVVAILRGRATEPSARLQRFNAIIIPTLIALMMALAAYASATGVRLMSI